MGIFGRTPHSTSSLKSFYDGFSGWRYADKLVRSGAITPDELRARRWEQPAGQLHESVEMMWQPDWRVTTRQAADALARMFGYDEPVVMTGDGPVRITDQWGSVQAGHIDSTIIGNSSDGIEPCGYEEL